MKRYSLKCVKECLSSDENGLTSYLACLRTCDDEDQDGDEDGDEDVSVTDDNDNVEGDESVEDDNDDDVNNDDGDVVYY